MKYRTYYSAKIMAKNSKQILIDKKLATGTIGPSRNSGLGLSYLCQKKANKKPALAGFL